ncbi:Sodium-dependent phosphate transporter [Clostridiaceae bacterium JG1575]|nr:Sodium-dependent phosphate transporter [Clostridiaceae bacterium JG1575]
MWIKVIQFFGSAALFLFGFKVLGEGLESVARGNIRRIMGRLTAHRIGAVLLGVLMTLLMQFSAATVVLTVGMVNSGIVNLVQAAGLILGANLSTPIKVHLFAWESHLLMALAFIAGTWLYVFSKEKRKRDVAYILLGFALMMTGLDSLRMSVAGLTQGGILEGLLAGAGKNWFVGLGLGTVITVLLQSSTATMAVLVTVSLQGGLSLAFALPIIVGANIGTTSTALVSAIGARREAKRAALLHLLFNLLAAAVFLPLGPLWTSWAYRLSPGSLITQLANLHLLFNVVLAVMGFLLTPLLIRLTDRLVPGRRKTVEMTTSPILDRRIITSPSIAQEHLMQQTLRMADYARDNFRLVVDAFLEGDTSCRAKVQSNEELINYLEVQITSFLVKLSSSELSERDHDRIMETHHMISELEKIGDLSMAVLELAQERILKDIAVSAEAQEEIQSLYSYVLSSLNVAIDSYRNADKTTASGIFDWERHINAMEKEFRDHHILRLHRGKCTPTAGILFLDFLANLERVGNHTFNMAQSVLRYAPEKP